MTFARKVVLGAVALVAGVATIVYLVPNPGKDEVQAVLLAGIEEARCGDADACIRRLSPDFKSEQIDYRDACAYIRAKVTGMRREDLEVRSIDVAVEGDGAMATLKLVLTEMGFRHELTLGLHLRRDGATWKIISGRELR